MWIRNMNKDLVSNFSELDFSEKNTKLEKIGMDRNIYKNKCVKIVEKAIDKIKINLIYLTWTCNL